MPASPLNMPPPTPGSPRPRRLGPRPRRGLRVAVLVLTVPLALAVGYSAYWLFASQRLRSAANDWIEARRADGFDVSYAKAETEGFPAKARLVFTNARIRTPADAVPWTWTAEAITAEISPFEPRRLTLVASGRQALELSAKGEKVSYVGAAEGMQAVIGRTSPTPEVEVVVRNLALDGKQKGDRLAFAHLEGRGGDPSGEVSSGRAAAYGVTLTAAGVTLPQPMALPLGSDIGYFGFRAKMVDPMPAAPWPNSLFRWRDAGGALELSRFDLVYGPMTLAGNGTIALDSAAQPIGAFTTRLQGYQPLLAALVRSKVITDKQAQAARAVLASVARPRQPGGEPVANVPLTLQDRTLSVGPVAIAKLPQIRWTRERTATR